MSTQLITNSITVGLLVTSIVGATVLAGFTNTSKGLYKEDRALTILFSLVFLTMIAIVFFGFLDAGLQFVGTRDIRSDVTAAIRTCVGVACCITFAFFLISLYILRKDPSKTQSFTSIMMYLSFLLSFTSISVLVLSSQPSSN